MEAFVDRYLARYRSFKTSWNYEDGCVLKGCADLYAATGEEKYRRFVLSYLDGRVTREGAIPSFDTGTYNIDSVNCGKVLFFALDETGQERYRKALDFVMGRLRTHPRCRCGSFWHKTIYPNQIWLDGLYMAQPFYLEYELRFNALRSLPDILLQFENVRRLLFNADKRLFYHGYDEARVQPWCDPVTGCSPNFWLRSVGWYLMALADCHALVRDADATAAARLAEMLAEAADGLLCYRDARTGLFYQVVDRADVPGNYTETSGSAMAAYALMKGALTGALPDGFGAAGLDVYQRLVAQKLREEGGETRLTGICSVAGLGPGDKRDGSVAYYLSEPVVSDDPKGVGPAMMAMAQAMLFRARAAVGAVKG